MKTELFATIAAILIFTAPCMAIVDKADASIQESNLRRIETLKAGIDALEVEAVRGGTARYSVDGLRQTQSRFMMELRRSHEILAGAVAIDN